MSDGELVGHEQSLHESSACLTGERVAFTGTLASMTHRQAFDLVEQHGGTATTDVSRQTTMLVVGEEGWPLEADGSPSQKWQHAAEFLSDGTAIRVLNEAQWLHLLGLSERGEQVRRLYTPAMLSELLGISASAVRRWERLGLIKPVRKVFRLPYFDFQEVAGARRILELLSAGVSRKELEESFRALESLPFGVQRPLGQLDVLARHARVLYRDGIGLVEPKSGQRCFDFEPAPAADTEELADADQVVHAIGFEGRADERVHWSADDWFHEGCRLLEENEPKSAAEAFRLCLMERPGDAETNFFLADALFRSENVTGAIERYYAAVEADHDYIEGWTQLGCAHAETGHLEAALEAFDVALDLHPDYPDAHWHKAAVLSQLGRADEASAHWQIYLEHDQRGPWAELARQRLEEAAGEAPSD